MKRISTRLRAVLQLFAVLAAAPALAAPAPSTDITLDVPAAFTASSITAADGGLYCVIGFVYHDEVPNASALAVLVDTNEHRVVWKTGIPYAKDHYENTATDCVREGDAYYVLTEEHTDSRPDRNQTQLVLNKLSGAGKLLASRQVDVGVNVWANARFRRSTWVRRGTSGRPSSTRRASTANTRSSCPTAAPRTSGSIRII